MLKINLFLFFLRSRALVSLVTQLRKRVGGRIDEYVPLIFFLFADKKDCTISLRANIDGLQDYSIRRVIRDDFTSVT